MSITIISFNTILRRPSLYDCQMLRSRMIQDWHTVKMILKLLTILKTYMCECRYKEITNGKTT